MKSPSLSPSISPGRRAAMTALLAGLLMGASGCIAPGQKGAVAVKSVAPQNRNQGNVTDPIVIEVSIGHTPSPITWIESMGKKEDWLRAGVAFQAAAEKRALNDKWRQRYESMILPGYTNLLASEQTRQLTELYHGLELVDALRKEFPKGRVFLSIEDGKELMERARDFSQLQNPQSGSLSFPAEPIFPAFWWEAGLFGYSHAPHLAAAPVALTVQYEVRKAMEANSALDIGGTYGKYLSALMLGYLAEGNHPIFASPDHSLALKEPAQTKPWHDFAGLLAGAPTDKERKRIKRDRLVHDKDWLTFWFSTNAPSEEAWKSYQTDLRARSFASAKARAALLKATMYEADRAALRTNSEPASASPFRGIHLAMSDQLASSIEAASWQEVQDQRVRAWCRGYDNTEGFGRELLQPEGLAPGSKARTLATFLDAELKLRERITDILLHDQYEGDLGNLVRGGKVQEEALAAKIRSMRGIQIAMIVLGGAGAGIGTAMAVSAASAGNVVAMQTANTAVSSINNSVTSAVNAMSLAAGSLNQRSQEFAVSMAEKIGPIQVEIAGELVTVQASNLAELRDKLRALYLRRYAAASR